MIKEVKNTVPWTMLLTVSMVKELLENFMKKNYEKQSTNHRKSQ